MGSSTYISICLHQSAGSRTGVILLCVFYIFFFFCIFIACMARVEGKVNIRDKCSREISYDDILDKLKRVKREYNKK